MSVDASERGEVVVTQADREEAANIWRDYVAKIGEVMVERSMRAGGLDHGLPSILARHRQAEARTAAPRDGWRPIASAPKDGTLIDLWIAPVASDGSRLLPCRVADAYCEEGQWYQMLTRLPLRVWHNPTHWQPLPAAPSSEAS